MGRWLDVTTTSLTKITSGDGYIQGSQLGKLDAELKWPSCIAARILRGGSTLTSIADVSDEELFAEVTRRMQGEPKEASNAEAEKSPVRSLDEHRCNKLIAHAQQVEAAAAPDDLEDEE